MGSPLGRWLQIFTNTAWRQRAHQRAHHGQVFLTTRETLPHQVIRCRSQVALLQCQIGTEAIEEGQLEVGRLAQCAMRTDLDAVATEDTAVESEGITVQSSLGHHQRTRRTALHACPTGYTIGVMQANVEGRRNDGVEALTEHAVAVGANHIVAHPHALRTVDTLVGIAQDEAVRQVNFVVVIVARFTIVEAVISQAVLDAILLQVTLAGRGAYTLQAAPRLAFSLFLQIAHLNNPEVALALLIRQHRHLYLRL